MPATLVTAATIVLFLAVTGAEEAGNAFGLSH